MVAFKRGQAGITSIGSTAADGAHAATPAATLFRRCQYANLLARWIRRRRAEVIASGQRLKYRDFITVALIIDQAGMFPDNWIYIHEPGVSVGRIQNFKNWSPAMVPDPRYTCWALILLLRFGFDVEYAGRGSGRDGRARARETRAGRRNQGR